MDVFASDAYKAEQFDVVSIEDIYAARNAYMNALDEQLQVESAVLIKNDDNLLPLSKDAKVYVDSSSEEIAAVDAEAIAAYATVVTDIAEADVVVAHVTSLNDASQLILEDAADAGKPVVLISETGNAANEVTDFEVEYADAILLQVYTIGADHGSSLGDYYSRTLPRITADMLFGTSVPGGSLVYEIARSIDDTILSFGDLQLDMGVDPVTRLYMVGTVRQDPTTKVPANLGDVLYPAGFGLTYGEDAAITLNTLIVPQVVSTVEVTDERSGRVSQVSSAESAVQKSGEPFTVYLIAQNDGADGYVTVEAYDGDALVGSKFVSVEGGSFVVVRLPVTLEGAGEHTLTIGGLTAVIPVE